GIDLLVPISLSANGPEALLAMGQKKSEEPYSGEDQELLLAIANSLALLLERPASTAASSGLEECSRCGACYDSGTGKCAQDGTQLTATPCHGCSPAATGWTSGWGAGGWERFTARWIFRSAGR